MLKDAFHNLWANINKNLTQPQKYSKHTSSPVGLIDNQQSKF